jgi:lysyl-tRNA synthetase class 2
MLEWYRSGFSYHRLMDEVAALVKHCGRGKFDHWPQQKLSFRQLFERYAGLDPFDADQRQLSERAKQHGVNDLELTRKQWLDLLISVVIQPALPDECLTFVYDFPADQAALARLRQDEPPVAERFELYLGHTELANGYQELTDAIEQKRGQPMYQTDRNLVQALEHGLPECAGVAIGVDRLLMAIVGAESISEVTVFPRSRA